MSDWHGSPVPTRAHRFYVDWRSSPRGAPGGGTMYYAQRETAERVRWNEARQLAFEQVHRLDPHIVRFWFAQMIVAELP